MLQRSTQIIYIPNYVMQEIRETGQDVTPLVVFYRPEWSGGVEFGFITSKAPEAPEHFQQNTQDKYFCRFWRKGAVSVELRNKSNSELFYSSNLIEHDYMPRSMVGTVLESL